MSAAGLIEIPRIEVDQGAWQRWRCHLEERLNRGSVDPLVSQSARWVQLGRRQGWLNDADVAGVGWSVSGQDAVVRASHGLADRLCHEANEKARAILARHGFTWRDDGLRLAVEISGELDGLFVTLAGFTGHLVPIQPLLDMPAPVGRTGLLALRVIERWMCLTSFAIEDVLEIELDGPEMVEMQFGPEFAEAVSAYAEDPALTREQAWERITNAQDSEMPEVPREAFEIVWASLRGASVSYGYEQIARHPRPRGMLRRALQWLDANGDATWREAGPVRFARRLDSMMRDYRRLRSGPAGWRFEPSYSWRTFMLHGDTELEHGMIDDWGNHAMQEQELGGIGVEPEDDAELSALVDFLTALCIETQLIEQLEHYDFA